MKIFVNNKVTEFAPGKSLIALLNRIGIEEEPGIAIAVNESVIPRNQWENFQLNDADKVIVIQATAGG